MKSDKITYDEWSQLSEEGKDVLKRWALIHGYGLETIPGPSGTFDPVCDYGALLTHDQMIEFIEEHKSSRELDQTNTLAQLWKEVLDIAGGKDKSVR